MQRKDQASNPNSVTPTSCVPVRPCYFPSLDLICVTYGKGLNGLTLESL